MNRHIVPFATAFTAMVCTAVAVAKLPPLNDEAKAKAAEAAAKKAYTEKVDTFKLCKSMDKVAAAYFADAKKANKETKQPVATPPCTDPGPFVAGAPAKPIEAAGAHSPPQNAASPPSTKQPQAEQPAAKK
jgi:hypothetical protein